MRQSRCNIGHSAQIAKDLAHDVEMEGIIVVFGVVQLGPLAFLLSKEPPKNTSRAYHEDNGRVPENGLQRSRGWARFAWGFGNMRNGWREAGPVCTMTALAVMALRTRLEEGSSFGGTGVWLWCGCRLVTPCESTVVEALDQQYNVCQSVVNGQNNLQIRSLACKMSDTQGNWKWRTIVGRTPCMTAPIMLKTSPSSQTMMNWIERASALPRWKF